MYNTKIIKFDKIKPLFYKGKLFILISLNCQTPEVNLDASLNFESELSTEYMMRSQDGKLCIDENYIIYHINMVKIVYKYYNNCRLTRFEKIIVMMCTRSIKVLEELAEGDEELMTFKKTLEEIGKDNGIIGLYNEDEMNELVYQTNLKESHDEGFKMGKESTTMKIAKKLLKLGTSIKDISEVTGLPLSEIKKLK